MPSNVRRLALPDTYCLLIDSLIGNKMEQPNNRVNDFWLRVDFQ